MHGRIKFDYVCHQFTGKQVKLWFYKLPVPGVEIKAVKLRKNQKSPNILHLQKFRYIPVCTGGKVILLYGTVPLKVIRGPQGVHRHPNHGFRGYTSGDEAKKAKSTKLNKSIT